MKAGGGGAGYDALLITWVVLIGADRIDFLGGDGAFHLTPYLVLTPIVLAAELLRRHLRRHTLRVTPQLSALLLVAFTLLGIVGISVFASPEITKSVSRAALLAVHLLGALSVVVAASDRTDIDRLFERGAVGGLLLFAVFDALQVASFLHALPEEVHVGPLFVDLLPSVYAQFVPQLSGPVADQNRAGLLLLFYGWFVGYRPGRGPRTGFLALAFVLGVCTLSRSASIAALATLAVLVIDRRVRGISVGFLSVLSVAAVAVVLTLLLSPAVRAWAGTALEPFAERASLDRGTAQQHFMLIQRGIDAGMASLGRLAIGLGYGSSYSVLQDVFPGHRYANFHSLYVTFFAESGVAALLCILLLFAVPLVRGGPYRALVAGSATFNLFYQAHTEPEFWVIIVLAWLTLPAWRSHARGAAIVRTGPSPALRTDGA